MKFCIFNGCPRGPKGITHHLVQYFLLGAKKFNLKFDYFDLSKRKVLPCTGCSYCSYITPGKCRIPDNTDFMIKSFLSSDYVIFATPVVMANVTGLMKNFIDRLTPLFEPYYEAADGEISRKIRHQKIPKFLVISTTNMPDTSDFEIISLFFKKLAHSMHTRVAAEILVTDAGLLSINEDVRLKGNISSFLEKIRSAGKEFVENREISKKTAQEISTPILDHDHFMQYTNELLQTIGVGKN